MTPLPRCPWAGANPLLRAYHDEEWGVPEYDSRALWEKLILDGFQAGLSWSTILHKRAAFRAAFDSFDPALIARYDETRIAQLLANPGIIRSRAKIEATIGNARAYLNLQASGQEFSHFVWQQVGGKPIRLHPQTITDVPVKTPLSESISQSLRRRGFKFAGPVIVYAWMQATGMVDDHLVSCFRHRPKNF